MQRFSVEMQNFVATLDELLRSCGDPSRVGTIARWTQGDSLAYGDGALQRT